MFGPGVSRLFFKWLDPVEHENYYNPIDGQNLGYILSDDIFARFKDSNENLANKKKVKTERQKMKEWVMNLLRANLSMKIKEEILNIVQFNMFGTIGLCNNYERVVLYGLSASCPSVLIQERLKGIVSLDFKEERLCKRHAKFGIHVVSDFDDNLTKLRKWVNSVELLDISAQANIGSISDAVLYQNMLHLYSKGILFIYIRGLRTISDGLLKWCAEYTKRTPWSYVYLENIDLTWNLVENLDRVFIHNEMQNIIENQKNLSVFPVNYIANSELPLHNLIQSCQFSKNWTSLVDEKMGEITDRRK